MLRKLPIIVLIFSCFYADAQQPITLNEAIEIATKNNLQVQRGNLDMVSADLDLKAAKLSSLPHVNFASTVYTNHGRSLDPTVYAYVEHPITTSTSDIYSSFLLFQGFRKKNQVEINIDAVDLAKAQLENLKKHLAPRVIAAYLNIMSCDEQLSIGESHLRFDVEEIAREDSLNKFGKSVLNNILALQAQLAKDSLTQIETRNRRQTSELELSQLMNYNENQYRLLPPDTSFTFDLNLTDENLKHAVSGNPEMKVTELKRQIALKTVDLAKSERYPTISLIGVLATDFSSIPQYDPSSQRYVPRNFFFQTKFNFYQYFGLNVNVPIFNAVYNVNKIKKEKINVDKAALEMEMAKQDIEKTYKSVMLDVSSAKNQYVAVRKVREATKGQFEAAKLKFELGAESGIDFDKSLMDFEQSEFQVVQAKYDMIFKEYILQYLF